MCLYASEQTAPCEARPSYSFEFVLLNVLTNDATLVLSFTMPTNQAID